jgi:hypothetical protein
MEPEPVLDDPRESSVQPLYWYGQKCLPAPGVPAHFLSVQREGSKITNARYALVNRKRDRVEQKDILDAELQYSQYAWDSILVENNSVIQSLDRVLLEFVGETSILTESAVRKCVSSAGIELEQVDHVIGQLVGLTFLGVEVAANRFAYADEKKERQKNTQLSTKFATAQGRELRYEINAPFRTYLEISETESSLRLS